MKTPIFLKMPLKKLRKPIFIFSGLKKAMKAMQIFAFVHIFKFLTIHKSIQLYKSVLICAICERYYYLWLVFRKTFRTFAMT